MTFRWLYSSSGKLIKCGKSAEQNEQLLKKVRSKDVVLHTAKPGSPFCLLSKAAIPQDLKEAAILCACFSQGWKKYKKMEVHAFRGEQLIKKKNMPLGTFGVLGKVQKLQVKLELWLGFQKGKLRAGPKSCFKEPLLKLLPGNIPKEKAAEKIRELLQKKGYIVSKEEILSAIPAGGFKL